MPSSRRPPISLRDIWVFRYALRPRSGGGDWNARSPRQPLHGFLLRAGGGFGCVQPWAAFGDPSVDDCLAGLRDGRPHPLVARALECAAEDAEARRAGRSLFDGLTVPASHATVTGAFDAEALRAEGFAAVKLKGGRDIAAAAAAGARAAAAGLRVRIDCNGVLNPDEFLAFADRAAGWRHALEFVEDPVPWDPDVWRKLSAETGLVLALDRAGDRSPADWPLRVVKPARERMPAAGEIVVTTSMDHPLGQLWAAFEAARYPGRQRTAGLLTHRLFADDEFGERLGAAGPALRLPGGTGLGFDDLLDRLPWERLDGWPPRIRWNPRTELPGPPPAIPEGCEAFATSGSGGVPTLVVHSRESLRASARIAGEFLALSDRDVWLRALPDFHVGGYQILTRAELFGSRVVHDTGRWDPERFRRLCEHERITATSLVPAQVHDLVTAGHRTPESLRFVLTGGGNLPDSVRRAARELGWPLIVSYGMTETASLVAAADGPDECALRLLPGWTARVRDPDAAGGGALELSGPSLCLGCHAWTGRGWEWVPIPDDGWLRTSDRATVRDGILTIHGRLDRTIKVLGELVDLDAVEVALVRAGARTGAFAVTAVPDLRAGHRLVLVSGDDGVPAEVLARYRASAPPFAAISDCLSGISLPRSPLGKILRRELDEEVGRRVSLRLPVRE